MIQITDKTTAMPIPEGAERVYFDGRASIGFYLNGELRFIHFPPGTWRFLFTTKTATEEEARKVMVPLNSPFLKGDKRYKDYTIPQSHTIADAVCTALESLASLLRSKGLDPKNNYALIEKQSSDE